MKKFRIIGGIFRWTARVVGGLTVLMFLAFAIGEGISASSLITTVEIVMMIGILAALIGILVSWRWTLIGCLLILAGYIVFSIGDSFDFVNPFLFFPAVVVLNATACGFDRLVAKELPCSRSRIPKS